MLVYFLFVAGFYILIKGADLLVDGSSSLARRFNVSDLVIGLTVVAFGTSTPELFVNIIASINGNTGIAIGNVIGSNIANILLILGLSSLVYRSGLQRALYGRRYHSACFLLLPLV
jgi:cation:H+ antiporter